MALRTREISKRNGTIMRGPVRAEGFVGAVGSSQFPAVGEKLERGTDNKGEFA